MLHLIVVVSYTHLCDTIPAEIINENVKADQIQKHDEIEEKNDINLVDGINLFVGAASFFQLPVNRCCSQTNHCYTYGHKK